MDYKELLEKYQVVLIENNNLKEEIKILRSQLGSTLKQDISLDQDIYEEFVEQKPSMEIILNEQIEKELPNNINNNSDTKSKIKLFNSLFKGRTDVYAKRLLMIT